MVTVVGHVNEVAVRRAQLVLGWVTVFGGHTTLVPLPSHPDQLRLLPSAGREMSTRQMAVMLRGWEAKHDGSFYMWINVWVAGKTV